MNYIYKYPRVFAIVENLHIKKKQFKRLYRITNQHYSSHNISNIDEIQCNLRAFLCMLDRHFKDKISFKNKFKRLKEEYYSLVCNLEREEFLKNNYGMRYKNLALKLIENY